jgi:hypothetical protein
MPKGLKMNVPALLDLCIMKIASLVALEESLGIYAGTSDDLEYIPTDAASTVSRHKIRCNI